MTPSAVTLVPAATMDLVALAALVTEAFADSAAPWPLSAETLASMVASDDIALSSSHVALLRGAPVGVTFVGVRYGRDTEDGAGARVAARTWLEALGVVPAARRGGVARLLLGRVLDEARARGSRTVALQVHASNAPARRLYESLGFVAARRLLGFTLPRPAVGRRGVLHTPRQLPAGSGTGISTDAGRADVSGPATAHAADGVLGARAARPLGARPRRSGPPDATAAAGVSGPDMLPTELTPNDKVHHDQPTQLFITLQPVVAPLALPLVEACLAGEAPAVWPAWQMETASLARLAPPAQVYTVVPHGERAVGYVALTQDPDAATAMLLHLGILPAARREGWGRAAVEAAFALYPAADSFTVPPLVPASSTLVPFLGACRAVRDPEEHLEMALTL